MSRHLERSTDQQPHASKATKNVTAPKLRPEPIIQRAQMNPSSLTPSDVLTLQRSIGNRATVRLLSPVLQTKLKVGPAGDRYEQEADRVAEQVIRQSDQGGEDVQRAPIEEEEIQTKPLSESISRLQRAPIEEDELQFKRMSASDQIQRGPLDEDELQFKRMSSSDQVQRGPLDEDELQFKRQHGLEGGEVESSVAQQIQTARGSGQPLDAKVRRQMERGFGANFQGVRVHTDQRADTLNRSLNARAFTIGNDVFFRSGEYKPGSSSGKKLLAHELTHTVQQGAVSPSTVQAKRLAHIIQRDNTSTTPLSILSVITDPRGYSLFYNFAKSRYEHFELECWKQIQTYKTKPRRSVAIHIFDTYVSLSAPKQVNIPEAVVKILESTIDNYRSQKEKQGKFNKGFRKLQSLFTGQMGDVALFDDLQQELIRALGDSYMQFTLTSDYQAFRDDLGRRQQKADALKEMLKQNNMY